ncbi:hypothetical protein DPMN_117943 [Dreissena polymorpha]|uniref:Uncharacterized protein n=1 Tax=Dreissena polymorpha TaxID=45954 RepID=A0A9D4JQN4_DREPO|nr:hypothetical protein DPMN_117943 [Dreissena polymorpha]
MFLAVLYSKINCLLFDFKGIIHTNGGSATSSGGGGGGYIALYYTSGYVDERDITSYGGASSNGENGAAGVIYLEQGSNKKVCSKVL